MAVLKPKGHCLTGVFRGRKVGFGVFSVNFKRCPSCFGKDESFGISKKRDRFMIQRISLEIFIGVKDIPRIIDYHRPHKLMGSKPSWDSLSQVSRQASPGLWKQVETRSSVSGLVAFQKGFSGADRSHWVARCDGAIWQQKLHDLFGVT